jgi:hypothetical protein
VSFNWIEDTQSNGNGPELYEHIVTSQQSPDGIPFRFTFDKDTLDTIPVAGGKSPTVSPPARNPSVFPKSSNLHESNESRGSVDRDNLGQKQKYDDRSEDEAEIAAKKGKPRYVDHMLCTACMLTFFLLV